MGSTSRDLKIRAKTTLRRRLFSILLIAVVFIVADYMLTWLASELSGLNDWTDRLYERLAGAAGRLGASADPEEMERIFTDIVNAMPPPSSFTRNGFGILLSVLVSLMSIPLSAGYTNHILKESRGIDTRVSSLLFGFRVMWKTLVISFLTGLAVLAGTLLFVIPGIIASLYFSLSVLVLADDPSKGPVQCMKESFRLMRGQKWRLCKLELSFFFWYLLSGIVTSFFGIPLLNVYLTPYVSLARAEFYKELLPGPQVYYSEYQGPEL